MPDHSYDAPGTENLRANPSTFGPAAAPNASGNGEDVGGKENLRAQPSITVGPSKSVGRGSNDVPSTTFTDDAV